MINRDHFAADVAVLKCSAALIEAIIRQPHSNPHAQLAALTELGRSADLCAEKWAARIEASILRESSPKEKDDE